MKLNLKHKASGQAGKAAWWAVCKDFLIVQANTERQANIVTIFAGADSAPGPVAQALKGISQSDENRKMNTYVIQLSNEEKQFAFYRNTHTCKQNFGWLSTAFCIREKGMQWLRCYGWTTNHFPWEKKKQHYLLQHFLCMILKKGTKEASSIGEFYLMTPITSSTGWRLCLTSSFPMKEQYKMPFKNVFRTHDIEEALPKAIKLREAR